MLPTVDPTELIPLQFDFNELLTDYPSAVITANRIAIEVLSGTDATPGSRLYGAATESALVVKQWFDPSDVTVGLKYRVTCNVDISGVNYKPTIAVEVRVDKRTDA